MLRPDLLRLWVSMVASWSAWSTSQVVLSFLVLAKTNSAFDVGLLFAARMLPMTIAGIPLGLLADRYGRRRLLVGANVSSGVVTGLLTLLATLPLVGDAYILAGAILLGLLDAARIVATQSLTYDLAGTGREVNALATANLLSGFGGAIGGLTGGVVLAVFGAVPAAALMSAEYLAAALPLLRNREEKALTPDVDRLTPSVTSRFDPSLRLVLVLAAVAVTVEILGFSSSTFDSVFAVSVFGVGAIGLGILTMARSVGRIAGSLLIAASAQRSAPLPHAHRGCCRIRRRAHRFRRERVVRDRRAVHGHDGRGGGRGRFPGPGAAPAGRPRARSRARRGRVGREHRLGAGRRHRARVPGDRGSDLRPPRSSTGSCLRSSASGWLPLLPFGGFRGGLVRAHPLLRPRSERRTIARRRSRLTMDWMVR